MHYNGPPKEPFKCATYQPGVGKGSEERAISVIPQNMKLIPCPNRVLSRQFLYSTDQILTLTKAETVLETEGIIPAPQSGFISPTSKPLAKVTPIINYELPQFDTKSVQTDAWSIDLDALCPLEDYARSLRIDGIVSQSDSGIPQPYDYVSLVKKIEELERALRIQTTVNRDIKKLLVASMGVSFSEKIEDLTRTNEEANQKIVSLHSQLTSASEQIDRIKIESDLWRSKFVASRVMLDEMAGWKQCISVRYKECIGALQMLLNERTRLIQELLSTRDLLLCACEALLPPYNRPSELLNDSEEHSPEESPSWLQYSIENRRLVRSLCLNIPGTKMMNLAGSVSLKVKDSHQHAEVSSTDQANSIQSLMHLLIGSQHLSPAEKNALEVLRNHLTLEIDPTGRYRCAYNSPESQQFERLAMSCCKSCKGESFII